MAKAIMIQGTMSNAGKSLVAAGLCRIFRQDGYKVCPFKSQNMALNSYITGEGLEMGRAQVMQAEAAGIEPSVKMNPVLLKPNSDTGSQVIVNGEVLGNMRAAEYYKRKQELIPEIMKSYRELDEKYDIIVIEGAGSPAEINLKENDIVNMGMARLADAPVLLVGDIDRGGVFAQLYGTVKLLDYEEQKRIKGLIINKFRGDVNILKPGLKQLETLTGIPVIGTLPYMRLDIDDEDSLSERLESRHASKGEGTVKIAVVRLPRLSNFTDFSVFEQLSQADVFYTASPKELSYADMIIIPGTKSTMADLKWLRQNGIEAVIQRAAEKGIPVFGICGGYQMLGEEIHDPDGIEDGSSMRGMGLLPVVTVFEREKHRAQVNGSFLNVKGALKKLSGMSFSGYEIHHGRTLNTGVEMCEKADGMTDGAQCGNVYGSYVHGIFDNGIVAAAIVESILNARGLGMDDAPQYDREAYRQKQYDMLADGIRSNMDIAELYRIM